MDETYNHLYQSDAPELFRKKILNRYKNAVFYLDDLLTNFIAEARLLLGEDTIVVLSGDHGEEFWEHGFFGHTSNFTNSQVQVPFVMFGPGIDAAVEMLPTSHLDVVPTLLELLGADPSMRREWCLGANLLSPPGPERRRVSSTWDLLGLHTPDAVLVVPTNTYRGLVEGWSLDWKPLMNDAPLISREGGPLGRLAIECGRFLR